MQALAVKTLPPPPGLESRALRRSEGAGVVQIVGRRIDS